MRRWASLLIVVPSLALADEATEVRDHLREGLTREPPGPLLHLDTAMRSNIEGFAADVKTERVDFALGPRTRATAEASAFTSELVNGQGWGASLRLVHDFKVIQIAGEASYQRVDSTFARGGYTYVGLSITRVQRLSRWMTGWISLSIGRRRWLGTEPPPGEANDTAVMLSIGTTFR